MPVNVPLSRSHIIMSRCTAEIIKQTVVYGRPINSWWKISMNSLPNSSPAYLLASVDHFSTSIIRAHSFGSHSVTGKLPCIGSYAQQCIHSFVRFGVLSF